MNAPSETFTRSTGSFEDDREPDGPTRAEQSTASGSNEDGEVDPATLVEGHADLVRSIARHVHNRTPPGTPFEDLVAFGFEGLLEAARRYDVESPASFGTYAYHRVRGAILDGHRRQQWGRGQTVQSVDATGLDETDSSRDVTPSGRTVIEPRTEAAASRTDREEKEVVLLRSREVDRIGQQGSCAQRERVERRETRSRLVDALATLEETEREVIERYDLREESLTSIADDLDCSKSWLSRLRSRALDKLRSYLEAAPDCADSREPRLAA